MYIHRYIKGNNTTAVQSDHLQHKFENMKRELGVEGKVGMMGENMFD